MTPSHDLRRKRIGVLLAALTALLLSSEPVSQLCSLPGEVHLSQGATAHFSLLWPVTVESDRSVVSSLNETLSDVTQVSLTGEETGEAAVTFRLLGFLPIRRMEVSVGEEKVLIPGGQSVGIAMLTEGVLVVGLSDPGGTIPSPGRLAGLRAGDIIKSAGGKAVNSAGELTALASTGDELALVIDRSGEELTLTLTPARDTNGVYRLGLWVRDGTAGIGTLTFYDPETNRFGALGHPVTDADTGVMLPVRSGNLLESRITEIHRGEKGTPGELVGRFSPASPICGTIEENGQCGLFGYAEESFSSELYPEGLPVMASGEVTTGKAQILTTLDGRGPCAYDCEIVRLTSADSPDRNFVLRVTDPVLLERTGGIVQGMSGSPVIQNGKLAGAVTHVLVNDPTKGYGIFIENMLAAAVPLPLRCAC